MEKTAAAVFVPLQLVMIHIFHVVFAIDHSFFLIFFPFFMGVRNHATPGRIWMVVPHHYVSFLFLMKHVFDLSNGHWKVEVMLVMMTFSSLAINHNVGRLMYTCKAVQGQITEQEEQVGN